MSIKVILPTTTIFASILLYILHTYAIENHWYLNIPFFDIITHFLGGVCIALSAFYILKDYKYIIIITVIAGILWEVFEVYYDITGWPVSSLLYKLDTIKDVIVDTLGALLIWYIVKIKNNE